MKAPVRQPRNDEGFTLIEVLIVIIVLAVLAAIVVFAVGTTSANAVGASCRSDAKTVESALEVYKVQHAFGYPTPASPTDYSPLTGTDTLGGPWLREAPATTHYIIAYDASGHVWVSPPSGLVAYDAAHDYDLAPNACNVSS